MAIRLAYAFAVKGHDALVGDALYYHYQAKFNLEGHWFVNPAVVFLSGGHFNAHDPELVSAQHPPLFTCLLTVADVIGLGSVGAQKVVVCSVGTASILVLGMLGKELAGRRAGMVSAFIASLYPGMWIYDGQVLSESLLIFLVTATMLWAYRCWRAPSWWRLCLVAGGCTLCALDRSEAILLVPLVAVPLAMRLGHGSWRRGLAGIGVVLALTAGLLAPWTIRNAMVFRHPVVLSDQLDITLAAANNNQTYYGHFYGSWCFWCLTEVTEPVADESVQAQFWKKIAETYVRHHLGRVPAVVEARLGITFGFYRPAAVAAASRVEGWPYPVIVAWFWWYYPLLVSAACGVFVLRARRIAIYPLLSLFGVVAAAVVLTYGDLRFRAEAEVAIVVLAAITFEAGWSKLAYRLFGENEKEKETHEEPSIPTGQWLVRTPGCHSDSAVAAPPL